MFIAKEHENPLRAEKIEMIYSQIKKDAEVNHFWVCDYFGTDKMQKLCYEVLYKKRDVQSVVDLIRKRKYQLWQQKTGYKYPDWEEILQGDIMQ